MNTKPNHTLCCAHALKMRCEVKKSRLKVLTALHHQVERTIPSP